MDGALHTDFTKSETSGGIVFEKYFYALWGGDSKDKLVNLKLRKSV